MDDDLKSIMVCFSTTFGVGLVLFIVIFVIGSLESLEITEVGLDYDTTRIKIDDTELYKVGRHYIGLTHRFIRF